MQLAEETRLLRRTIADAIEVLRKEAGFARDDKAIIDTFPLGLPRDSMVCLIALRFVTAGKVAVVSLPTSAHFNALREGQTKHEAFEIPRLQGAIVDDDEHILLVDGTRLRAVVVKPANLPLEPSKLDRRIVELTIAITGAEKRCYRRLTDKPPKRLRRIRDYRIPRRLHRELRDVKFLDCSALRGLPVPPLKVLGREIGRRDPSLKNLSRQKLADTLASFGVRIPKARPRKLSSTKMRVS